MTQQEWLASEDVLGMFRFVRDRATVTDQERRAARQETRRAIPADSPDAMSDFHCTALMLFREFASSSPAVHAAHAEAVVDLVDPAGGRVDCHVLREIVGNPFRSLDLASSCRTPTVLFVARPAYEERDLATGQLDSSRLSVLSDALEEAGCEDDALLEHLRSAGPHVRGCWALDLILGKD